MTKRGYQPVLKTKLSTRTLLILSAVSALILLITLLALGNTGLSPASVSGNSGWQRGETATYYILSDGSNATGWQEIDGETYFFRDSGSMVTGWLVLDDQHHYFLEDGTAASGPVTIGNDLHIFEDRGIPATGWTIYEGRSLYLDSTGKPMTGWQTIGDTLYYFDQNGFPCPGWLEQDGKKFYIRPDGTAALGRNIIDGATHYFASNGQEIVLVNPWNYVPVDYTVELKKLDSNYQVAVEAYDDLQLMLADCKAGGGRPVICSAYRTQEYQENLYNKKVKKLVASGLSQEQAEQEAGTVVAVPGTSEHQLGLALDIIDYYNWTLDESQEHTKTQQWLMANSWQYGWILRYPNGKSESTGIIYEPWHYRYVGREIAAEIHELGLCLEEYLDMLTTSVG